MARLFLTNINLNQNELQNAVIQNLSTAPSSGNTEGRIYYDSTRKTLRVWRNDALQGAKWYDLSVGGASASTVTLTGDVTGTANVDPTTGIITVNTHFNVSGTTHQIVVNDISNTTTISLADDINVASGITIGKSTKDGYINIVNSSGTQVGRIAADGSGLGIASNDGDLNLYSDSGVINTDAELHIPKTEYWRNNSNHGAVLAHPSDGSLTVAATGWLHLESHDGGINIDADNGQVTFNNEIRLNSNGTIETNNSDLVLSPDTGNVVINNTLVTDNIISKDGSADTLNISASAVQITSTDVKVGGSGTNGKFQVLKSDGTNAFVIDGSNKEAHFGGNLTVDGDLNVSGNLNAVNRTEINVDDNTIRLNTGFTGTPIADAGIIVERGTANDTAIIWSESNKDWTLTNDGSHYYAIARKFVSVIGDASNRSFDVVHNMNTRDLTVQVRENNADYNLVETDVAFKDANTVTISFTVAPDANAYKVIIVG
jgi:hypothetical protein